MDRERLKQIIVEEVLRALERRRAGGHAPNPGVSEAGAPETGSASPEANTRVESADASDGGGRIGLVVLTGEEPPAPAVITQLRALLRAGWRVRVLTSATFRQQALNATRNELAGMEIIADPDHESAMARELQSAAWIVAPQVSANTLTKTAIGIADSSPTRALAWALRHGRPCLLIEGGIQTDGGPAWKEPMQRVLEVWPAGADTAPGQGANRLARLRELERRGATLTNAARLMDDLHRCLESAGSKLYEPPETKPSPRRSIVTGEDVYEAQRQGRRVLDLPVGAIVTAQAVEDAARRGIELRRAEDEA